MRNLENKVLYHYRLNAVLGSLRAWDWNVSMGSTGLFLEIDFSHKLHIENMGRKVSAVTIYANEATEMSSQYGLSFGKRPPRLDILDVRLQEVWLWSNIYTY